MKPLHHRTRLLIATICAGWLAAALAQPFATPTAPGAAATGSVAAGAPATGTAPAAPTGAVAVPGTGSAPMGTAATAPAGTAAMPGVNAVPVQPLAGMGAAPFAVPGITPAVTGQSATVTPPVATQAPVPPPSTGFPSPRGPTMRGAYQGALSPTMPSNQVPGVIARPAPPMPPPVATAPVKGLPPGAPALVINGGVYSANPKNRLVIVNGQVVREGADLGSGVMLEQINPSGVVVGFRGAHYRLAY